MELYLTAAVVLAAAAAMLAAMRGAHKKHRALYMKRSEASFTICGGRRGVIIVCFALFVPVAFSLLFAFLQLETEGVPMRPGAPYYIFHAAFLAVAALLCADYANHALSVSSGTFVYTDWLGRKHGFSLNDIGRATAVKGRLMLFGSSGELLAVIDKSMLCSYEIIRYLKKHGIAQKETLGK